MLEGKAKEACMCLDLVIALVYSSSSSELMSCSVMIIKISLSIKPR